MLVRYLTQWTVVFLTLWGREESARPIVDRIKALNELINTQLVEANLKRRFVAARENRKTNGCCDYGIQYSLNGVVNTMKEDRSRMDANKLKSYVEDLTKQVDKLRKWRGWFVEQVNYRYFPSFPFIGLFALFSGFLFFPSLSFPRQD